jgi:hypothetical protein
VVAAAAVDGEPTEAQERQAKAVMEEDSPLQQEPDPVQMAQEAVERALMEASPMVAMAAKSA